MDPHLQRITKKLTQLVHPLTNQPLNPAVDIAKLYYQADKLIITFAFVRVYTSSFRTFQRALLKMLKQDLQIQQIQLNYSLQNNLPSRPIGSQMTQLFPKAKFIAIRANDIKNNTAAHTISLAKAYARIGKKVAIIDVDIIGSSIPLLMNIKKEQPQIIDIKLQPFTQNGIDVISTSLLVSDTKPMHWRSEMIENLLQQFLYDVA